MSHAPRRSVVVCTLGLTQILAWGSSYYLVAILADPVSQALHVPRVWFFGMYSAALLVSGLLGPVAGRVIDRRGGRDVLAATNLVLATGLVVLGSASGSVGLICAWGLIGVGMGFGLYEAAFATVARLYGQEARSAITGITILAGFASTVSWPVSTLLVGTLDWRGTCFAWAALHVLVGLPMNRLLIPPTRPTDLPAEPTPVVPPGTIRTTMFVLAGVFGVTWFIASAWAAHLPRMLQALGASQTTAIAAASLVGPAQVVARVLEFTLFRPLSPLLSVRLATVLHPLGAVLLAVCGSAAAIPFVLLHGAGNGMLTIARGTLPLALFGSAGYGARAGLLAAPARLLQGIAPVLFGVVLDQAGPVAALALSGSLMAGCWLTFCLLRMPPSP